MEKYALGIDFGTLSGRCVLANVRTGEERFSLTQEYRHGVMTEALPDGTPLGPSWALHHPQDYVEVLAAIPRLLAEAGVTAGQVISVGLDATACTLLPVRRDGTPLCMLPEYVSRPHAYAKLWKHHAAQSQADRITRIAAARGEPFLARYGGKISSEWAVPKIWQILDEDPEIYAAADLFVEISDWAVFRLCGRLVRNSPAASLKALWDAETGYPGEDFFAALDPRLRGLVKEKLDTPILGKGRRAGGLTAEAAGLTGLLEGTSVAVADLDGTGSLLGAGLTRAGQALMVLGTSNCVNLLGTGMVDVPGMCSVARDSFIPGLTGYEAGQSCVGDAFQWAVDRITPPEYHREAAREGISVHDLLTRRCAGKRPGESGLLCLDWWNGNRSVLVDADLTGLLLGVTLSTRAEDIYRALIESAAFGTRVIVEAYRAHGVPVTEVYISGGIAQKNPFVMQVYADVLDMPVRVIPSPNLPAYSSAVWGALAAGGARGGFDSMEEAVAAMGKRDGARYCPEPEHTAVYGALYREYVALHDYFGRGANRVMKRLKHIAEEAVL